MKLVFDARHMALQYTGLGRYTASLLKSLLLTKTNAKFSVQIVLNRQVDWNSNIHFQSLERFGLLNGVEVSFVDWEIFSITNHLRFAVWLNRTGADLYFYPHFDLPFFCRVPSVFVVHDLIPLLVDGYLLKFSWIKKAYFKVLLNRSLSVASRCVAVSNVTRSDILSIFGSRYFERIDVVYEGPVVGFDEVSRLTLDEYGVSKPYLLYVGDRRPHKRLDRIIEIFFKLNEIVGGVYQLVLVGSQENYGLDIDAMIHRKNDVIVVGNISDSELASFYAYAESLIFLSEYEGFGLPVVEAARFNRKVILSDGGALAEIAPPHACLVPGSAPVDVMAEKIKEYLCSSMHIDCKKYLEHFSWEKAARSIFPEAYL